MGRTSNRASIAKKARSSKKAKENVHYLDGVDEDDENEEGINDEECGELEEAMDFGMKSSRAIVEQMPAA